MTEKHFKNDFSHTRNWHKTLLEEVSRPKGSRKALISEDTQTLLLEYLQFRHFFRHSYGFSLYWNKIKQLVFDLEKNWGRVKSDITDFLEKGCSHG